MLDRTLTDVLDKQWLFLLVIAALLLGLTEFGFRLGVRLHERKDEARKGQIGGIQGAVLGMLGLLLGFTFSMAVSRYEARRDLVLQEANAIGTTYLNAALLPAPHQAAVENLLRRYVEVRLAFYAAGANDAKIGIEESKAAGVQRELWAHAVAASQAAPTPITPVFISSLSETIDLDAAQMHAQRAYVPGAVWALVLAVAGCGCCASGYAAGASGERGAFTAVVLPLLVAVVINLIADINSPRRGLIRIDPQPLLDLKQSLNPIAPSQ